VSSEKQHTPEFEDCIQKVMKQGHEKASAFAICTTTFQKADKPLYVGESENQKLHLFSESIKISGNKVSGVCIHPKRIFHPEEGLEHVYLKEELEKAAPTLIGKPFGIDHIYVLPPPNVINNAWYDPAENGVAYEGIVDDDVAERIQRKEFKGISIELNWLRPGGKVEFHNGVAPKNFELTSVHLLKRFPPGDKDAYIKFWNAIMEQLVLGPPRTIDDRMQVVETTQKDILTSLKVLEGKIDVLSRAPPQASSSSVTGSGARIQVVTIPLFEAKVKDIKEQGMTKEQILQKIEDLQKQVSENDKKLYPESTLSPEDKEKVRTENSQLHTELEAYRQALAELVKHEVQTGESEEVKSLKHKLAEAEKKLQSQEPPADVVALRKDLVEAQAKLSDVEKKTKAEKDRFIRFHEAVKGTLPDRAIELRWLGTGPKMFAEKVKRVLHEFNPT